MNQKVFFGFLFIILCTAIGLTVSSRTVEGATASISSMPIVVKDYPIIETGKIVFASYRDGNSELYSMNYDGSNLTRLTNNDSDEGAPDWSPDGTKIIFSSDRDGQAEIYIMDADGSGQTRLTTMGGCVSPQWSPDGTRIAFIMIQDYINLIYTMNPDGTGLFQVTQPSHGAESPSWSPDGTRVAFLSYFDSVIYAINTDGSNLTPLFASNGIAYFAWSPDGERLALSMGVPPHYNFDLYVYNMATATLSRVTNTTLNHNSADWSPDGNYLVTHSNRDDISNFEIYTLTATGYRITKLTDDASGDLEPDWTR